MFQGISGGSWGFLGDLSSPDSFVKFPGEGFTLPLYFINPTFGGINVLPILMGVVFLVQQKLTSPPPANEQAAQQQRIMQIMMVVMFPVMLYSAPSGLTLYILSSTFAGIVDSYIVRRHIKREEEAGTLFEKKPPKPGGIRDWIQQRVSAIQDEVLARQEQQHRQIKRGGGGKRSIGEKRGGWAAEGVMRGVGDTIVAVGSPPGRSARGLVRVSGGGVVAILGELLSAPRGAVDGVRAWPVSGRVVPWRVRLGEGLEVAGLVGYWRGPRSYTGQDVAEVQVPGHPGAAEPFGGSGG